MDAESTLELRGRQTISFKGESHRRCKAHLALEARLEPLLTTLLATLEVEREALPETLLEAVIDALLETVLKVAPDPEEGEADEDPLEAEVDDERAEDEFVEAEMLDENAALDDATLDDTALLVLLSVDEEASAELTEEGRADELTLALALGVAVDELREETSTKNYTAEQASTLTSTQLRTPQSRRAQPSSCCR